MRLFGIKITFGATLAIPFTIIGVATIVNPSEYLFDLIAVACVYLFVLAHEFGHVYAGEKFGAKCEGIHLFLFGGAAKYGMSLFVEGRKKPSFEFWVAIAGPIVTAVYVAAFGIVWHFWQNYGTAYLLMINLAILIFNAIPIFPLDGGRMLRSSAAMAIGYVNATRLAGKVMIMGCVMMFIGGVLGTWPALSVMSILVFMMGRGEIKECLDHDIILRLLAARTKFITGMGSQTDKDPEKLEDDYLDFVSQGMMPRSALNSAYMQRYCRPFLVSLETWEMGPWRA